MSRSGMLLRSGPALAAVALLCLAVTSLAAPKPAAAKGKGHGASRQSFLMITEGMSLKDVQRIIGPDGKERGEALNPTYGNVTIWMWGNEKNSIRVHLSNGKVIAKYEVGLNK